MAKIIHRYTEAKAYRLYAGQRVRIVWHPIAKRWQVFVLNAAEDFETRPAFEVDAIELHTVGTFADIKPPYAPEGTPSFVGTVASRRTLVAKTAERITAHPYAPCKLFVGGGDGEEFSFGKRVLVSYSRMYRNP